MTKSTLNLIVQPLRLINYSSLKIVRSILPHPPLILQELHDRRTIFILKKLKEWSNQNKWRNK